MCTLNHPNSQKASNLARLTPDVGAVELFAGPQGEPRGMFGKMVGGILGKVVVGNVQEKSRKHTGGTVSWKVGGKVGVTVEGTVDYLAGGMVEQMV